MRDGKVLGPPQGACGVAGYWTSVGSWAESRRGGLQREGGKWAGVDLDRPFPDWGNLCHMSLEPHDSKHNLGCRKESGTRGRRLYSPSANPMGNRGSGSLDRPQVRPGRTHAPCARPAPLHPGTRRSRHFAGHSLALAAAILRWRPALGEPRPLRGRPQAAARPGLRLPLAAGGADSTLGPPRHHPCPGACHRRPASSGRPQAARRPGPSEPVPPGPSPLSRAGP